MTTTIILILPTRTTNSFTIGKERDSIILKCIRGIEISMPRIRTYFIRATLSVIIISKISALSAIKFIDINKLYHN